MLVTTNFSVNGYAEPLPFRRGTFPARPAYDRTMLHPAAAPTAALLLGRLVVTGAMLLLAAVAVRRR
jgi:hypothetical protein